MDEAESQIKLDLKDSIIKEALNTGVDLRHYSQQVEKQLKQVTSFNSLSSDYANWQSVGRGQGGARVGGGLH